MTSQWPISAPHLINQDCIIAINPSSCITLQLRVRDDVHITPPSFPPLLPIGSSPNEMSFFRSFVQFFLWHPVSYYMRNCAGQTPSDIGSVWTKGIMQQVQGTRYPFSSSFCGTLVQLARVTVATVEAGSCCEMLPHHPGCCTLVRK